MRRGVGRTSLTDEGGATAVEYAILASLIAVAVVTGVSAIGDVLGGVFGSTELELVADESDAPGPHLVEAESPVPAVVDPEPTPPVPDSDDEEDDEEEVGNSGRPHPGGGPPETVPPGRRPDGDGPPGRRG